MRPSMHASALVEHVGGRVSVKPADETIARFLSTSARYLRQSAERPTPVRVHNGESAVTTEQS